MIGAALRALLIGLALIGPISPPALCAPRTGGKNAIAICYKAKPTMMYFSHGLVYKTSLQIQGGVPETDSRPDIFPLNDENTARWCRLTWVDDCATFFREKIIACIIFPRIDECHLVGICDRCGTSRQFILKIERGTLTNIVVVSHNCDVAIAVNISGRRDSGRSYPSSIRIDSGLVGMNYAYVDKSKPYNRHSSRDKSYYIEPFSYGNLSSPKLALGGAMLFLSGVYLSNKAIERGQFGRWVCGWFLGVVGLIAVLLWGIPIAAGF